MPVEVNWSNMDTALMARFWNARPAEEREGNADMSDRVLVYHRGITSVCTLSCIMILFLCGKRSSWCKAGT